MIIEANLITGMMLGFELVELPEEECQHLVVDILFVRFVFSW